MENIVELAFNKRVEEINLSKEEQEKIIGHKKIYLQDILDKIVNPDIQTNLLKYEEQQNMIYTAYSELFYKAGFQDGLSVKQKEK